MTSWLKAANEIIYFCNKVCNEEFDSKKFNLNLTNVQLDDIFTTGRKNFQVVEERTCSEVDEALLQTRKTIK